MAFHFDQVRFCATAFPSPHASTMRVGSIRPGEVQFDSINGNFAG
jgi:hypothetical protein